MMDQAELEDLEAHLYSQIYHTNDTTDEIQDAQSEKTCLVNPADAPTSTDRSWNEQLQKVASDHVNQSLQNQQNQPEKPSTEYGMGLTEKEAKIAKKKAKFKKYIARKKQIRAEKEHKQWKKARNIYLNFIEKSCFANVKDNSSDDVITLSDSDENDDSCFIIDDKYPSLSVLDSDDAIKTNPYEEEKLFNETQGDVIFVEPVPVSVEVINLDEDFECSLDKSSKFDTSAACTTAALNKSKNDLTKQVQQERTELLRTPDSTSNDFMNNSGIELSKTNFNFSQHGSDFNNEFVKPSKSNETCETESSSSTTDVNSINILKTAVFSEVEFPKDIFSEGNLEEFGNFITPLRSRKSKVHSSPLSTSTVGKPKKKTAKIQAQNNSSDSSSESEPDDNISSKQFKNLPELSPMQSLKQSTPAKKVKDKQSESVIIDTSQQEEQTKSASKKKKNKKKRSETEVPVEASAEELKVKKRKSGQLDAIAETLDSSKKKHKSKKKKTSVGDNHDTAEPTSAEAKEIVAEKNTESTNDFQPTPTVEEVAKDVKMMETSKAVMVECCKQDPPETVSEISEVKRDEQAKISGSEVEDVQPEKTLHGFIIVDETFSKDSDNVASSDSESVLSQLKEPGDISLINCTGHLQLSATSDESDYLKNFSVSGLQSSMSNDPKLWSVIESDKTPLSGKKGKRCNKCKELGHNVYKCTNRIIPKCKICGGVGHYEPRCPNKLCNQCGKESPYSTTYCKSCFKLRTYMCSLCSMTGHLPQMCPDLWRRYHLTTTEGPLIVYDGPALKKKEELWCSGCAQSGHLEHTCPFYKSIYPPTNPFIQSYEDVYCSADASETANPTQPEIEYQQNYSDNNSYGQQFDSSQRYFINNQQNFYYNSDPSNLYQYPEMPGYAQVYNNFNFQSNLPNYISFETPPPPQESYEKVIRPETSYGEDPGGQRVHWMARRHNAVFFSATSTNLYQFIKVELGKLQILAYNKQNKVKEFKKRQVPRDFKHKSKYYQTLNMLLFGIYNFEDGKIHVDRLKAFKMNRSLGKLNHGQRERLYKSYRYVFGHEQHLNVDYNLLLSRL